MRDMAKKKVESGCHEEEPLLRNDADKMIVLGACAQIKVGRPIVRNLLRTEGNDGDSFTQQGVCDIANLLCDEEAAPDGCNSHIHDRTPFLAVSSNACAAWESSLSALYTTLGCR